MIPFVCKDNTFLILNTLTMKLFHKFIILIIALCLVSCNSARRASKRIHKITEQHPELLAPDTVKIDTVLTVKPAADSVIFAFDEVSENQTEEILTNEGCFAITLLPSREIKVVYTPDSVNVNFRKEIVTEKIHVEKPRELWRDILLYAILVYVFCLIVKTLIEKILK